jgi:hypothetical protein
MLQGERLGSLVSSVVALKACKYLLVILHQHLFSQESLGIRLQVSQKAFHVCLMGMILATGAKSSCFYTKQSHSSIVPTKNETMVM